MSRKLVNDPVGSDAYKVFERDMVDMTDLQVVKGLEKSRDFVGWFSLPAFRELCRLSPEDLGLPDAHRAYVEAATHSEGKEWSHGAVYQAAKETGFFELRTGTEREVFPLFRNNYEAMCRRVIAGENLDMPVQKALPESVFIPADEAKAKGSVRRMKDLLTN